jgi:hypothetical protein
MTVENGFRQRITMKASIFGEKDFDEAGGSLNFPIGTKDPFERGDESML